MVMNFFPFYIPPP